MFFVESVGNYECHAVAAAKDSSEDQVEKCFEGRMIILHSVAEKWFDTWKIIGAIFIFFKSNDFIVGYLA